MDGAPPYDRTDAQTGRALPVWEGTALLGAREGACRKRVGHLSHGTRLGDPEGCRTWKKNAQFADGNRSDKRFHQVLMDANLRRPRSIRQPILCANQNGWSRKGLEPPIGL